jgi:hypothetical protein
MELDVVGFRPKDKHLIHYEPSIDALSCEKREARYKKKFEAGKRYILKDLFGWLPENTKIEQVAVFPSHPKGRDAIAGGRVMSVDEFMAEVKSRVTKCGPMVRNAISEQYPLLRTIQMAQTGYMRALTEPS